MLESASRFSCQPEKIMSAQQLSVVCLGHSRLNAGPEEPKQKVSAT
jgi:hypothetical protein